MNITNRVMKIYVHEIERLFQTKRTFVFRATSTFNLVKRQSAKLSTRELY